MKCEMMVDIDQIWADVDALRDVNRRANQRRGTRETARSLRPPCAHRVAEQR